MLATCLAVPIALLVGLPVHLAAQDFSTPVPVDTASGDHGTYLKTGIAYWQGNIFQGNSLTRWNGRPFGADYNLTSAEVEIETYFSRSHLLLSGWSIGYRKDALERIDSGHMLSVSGFRTVNVKVFEVRAGGGMEWGIPSLNFDSTTFDRRADGAIRYNHTYPVKNVNVPGIGTKKDGAFYPFLELSLVQRPGRLLLEGGMRVNIVRFQFDTYEVEIDDQITHGFSSRRTLMPMLFVDIGFKLF